jgi:hypothetical protein
MAGVAITTNESIKIGIGKQKLKITISNCQFGLEHIPHPSFLIRFEIDKTTKRQSRRKDIFGC